jgi:PRTRC genetic system ThiF family protein
MKTVHFTDSYLLNPQHEITIVLIGAGGTGSLVLTSLGRINTALRAFNHPGLFVTMYDPDIVTPANMGRQLFTEQDAGLNKASCLITRINRFFGTDWSSVSEKYDGQPANIVITCTDNIESRLHVQEVFHIKPDRNIHSYEKFIYWMDFGNTRTTGQVILGSVEIKQPVSEKFTTVSQLPTATELFDYTKINEHDSGPSCSLAAALQKQDLFINSSLAQLGCGLFWKMFSECMIEYHGVFLNLETLKCNPLKIRINNNEFPYGHD